MGFDGYCLWGDFAEHRFGHYDCAGDIHMLHGEQFCDIHLDCMYGVPHEEQLKNVAHFRDNPGPGRFIQYRDELATFARYRHNLLTRT